MQIIITDADVRFVGDEMKPFADLILDDLEKLSNNDFFFFLSAPKWIFETFQECFLGSVQISSRLDHT